MQHSNKRRIDRPAEGSAGAASPVDTARATIPEADDRRWWMAFAITVALYVAAAAWLPKPNIPPGADGFYTAMQQVERGIEHDLRIVHLVRYITIYPAFWLWKNDLHPFPARLLLLAALLPICLYRHNGRRGYWQLFLLVPPLVVSFRTSLVACALGYLFLAVYQERPRRLLVGLSALFANLSSGVALCWLFIAGCWGRTLFRRHGTMFLVSSVLIAGGLSLSIVNKLGFFTRTAAAQSVAAEVIADDEEAAARREILAMTANASLLVRIASRSTIVICHLTGDHQRMFRYLGLMFAAMIVCGHILFHWRRQSRYFSFFALAPVCHFAEGLGPVAFAFALAWYMEFEMFRPWLESRGGARSPALDIAPDQKLQGSLPAASRTVAAVKS